MLRASVRHGQPGRLRSLLVGMLVLGGVLAALSRFGGTGVSPVDAAVPPRNAAKDKTGKDTAVKWPEPIKLTIAAKNDEELSRITEMVSTINKLSEAKWKENQIVPSRYADDYEFHPPRLARHHRTHRQAGGIREYMKDSKETRRSKLINRLLDSDEYPRHWANLWANWLLSRAGVFGRGDYHEWLATWLEDQFSQNKPYSTIVKSLLTASGENNDTEKGGAAANFILAHLGENVPPAHRGEEGQFQMVPLTSRITRLFLGTQVQCAQCHDHPFYSNVRQEHFWGVNAFLRQVVREGQPPQPGRRMMAYNKLTLKDDDGVAKDAQVFFEKRNGVILVARAEFLAQRRARSTAPVCRPRCRAIQRREKLAEFIIDHPQFSRAITNRMWGVFFGRGFVNPIDDFNDQNQPSNPELLDDLSARFKHYDYDTRN